MIPTDFAVKLGIFLGAIGSGLGIINSGVLFYRWFRDFGKPFSVRSYGIAYTPSSDYDDLDIVLINKNRIKNLGVDSIRFVGISSEKDIILKGVKTIGGEIEDMPIYFRQLEKKTVRYGISRSVWDNVRDKTVVLEIRDTDDKTAKVKFDYKNTNGDQQKIK